MKKVCCFLTVLFLLVCAPLSAQMSVGGGRVRATSRSDMRGIMIMGGVMAHPDYLAANAMFGYKPSQFGGYVRVASNGTMAVDETYWGGKLFYGGGNRIKYSAAVAGVVVSLTPSFMLLVGGGYGKYNHYVDDINGDWYEYRIRKGLQVETGVVYRINKLLIGVNADYLAKVTLNLSASLGVMF